MNCRQTSWISICVSNKWHYMCYLGEATITTRGRWNYMKHNLCTLPPPQPNSIPPTACCHSPTFQKKLQFPWLIGKCHKIDYHELWCYGGGTRRHNNLACCILTTFVCCVCFSLLTSAEFYGPFCVKLSIDDFPAKKKRKVTEGIDHDLDIQLDFNSQAKLPINDFPVNRKCQDVHEGGVTDDLDLDPDVKLASDGTPQNTSIVTEVTYEDDTTDNHGLSAGRCDSGTLTGTYTSWFNCTQPIIQLPIPEHISCYPFYLSWTKRLIIMQFPLWHNHDHH